MDSTEPTKVVSVSVGDCEIEIVANSPTQRKLIPAANQVPGDEFLFQYDKAIRLTDTLHSRQFEDDSKGARVTEIFIRRKQLGGKSIFGNEETIIPLLRITSH